MKRLLFISLILLSACSPQKQLSKLMKNHPEMFQDKTTVTVRHDTITTKEVHKDSVIHNITTLSKDTVFIRENHMTIKYLYKGGDSAYLSGVVASYKIPHNDTTIYKNTTIIKEVKTPKTTFEKIEEWFFWIVLSLIAGTIFGPMIKKLVKSKI